MMPMRDVLRHLFLVFALLLLACPRPGKEREAQDIKKTAPPPVVVRADDPDLIQYTLRFGQRHNHYVDVEAVFPGGSDTVELVMAVWTPGSYLVREYSRHVEAMTASTPAGEALAITKLAKNRWRVDAKGAERVAVRYRLYASELTVRTNYVDDEVAIINGAATFLRVADDRVRPFDIALELPKEWPACATALDAHPGGTPHRYVAPDFDTLVDSPIMAGDLARHEFAVAGVPHAIVSFGEGPIWDGPRAARDVEAIVKAQAEFWGSIPYRKYLFLNALVDGHGGGGLEHRESTLMIESPWATRKREDYQRWLGLVSHEFFHTWNVKRLRPEALGPFDYESENYTRSLWIAEGVTSYYDDLLVRRAGLFKQAEYLDRLAKQIETLQTVPGRAVQSLSESSFDSWIKFYRPNENSSNAQVNYYNKGAVVGFLLDFEIRRATQNRRSLDDAMRLAYQRFSGERGYTPEDFRKVVAEVAGQPLDDFFARAVDGTEELDYGPALAFYGLRFAPDKPEDQKDEKDKEEAGYMGVDTGSDGVVRSVVRDSPAYVAGIGAQDEILAIDDYRVSGDGIKARLEHYRPGDKAVVLVSRHGKLRRIEVALGQRPKQTWKLEIDPGAPRAARTRRDMWLGQELELAIMPQ